MITLYKSHSHIHYEEAYRYKKFQKFTIKALTTIAYPNFKNKQKVGPGHLGVIPPMLQVMKSIVPTGDGAVAS